MDKIDIDILMVIDTQRRMAMRLCVSPIVPIFTRPYAPGSSTRLGYVMYVMVTQGIEWDESVQQFVALLFALQPYFAYMTGIPLVMVGVIMAARRRRM